MAQSEYNLLLQCPGGETILDHAIDEVDGGCGEHPKREVQPEQESDYLASNAPLNSLAQGWGVLYPQGRKDLLEAIAPLRTLRQQQVADEWNKYETGPTPKVGTWAIAPNWSAHDFIERIYDKLGFEDRPYYLLLLGDFDEISVEFQLDLAGRAAVGRLCFRTIDNHFDELEGYRSYVTKIVRSEQASSSSPQPQLLLYSTSKDFVVDRAVDHGHEHFIEPTRRRVTEDLHSPYYTNGARLVGPKSDTGLLTWDDLREVAAGEQPSVLLTLSHGAGHPGWDAPTQRASQGCLKLDRTTTLDPQSLANGSFLSCGAWFYFACFGAGTPSKTAYQAWLNELYRLGVYTRVPDVLKSLARDGRPFVARTPMMALANREGPLMVFAHADLAFTYSYSALPGQKTFTAANGRVVANPFEGGQPFISDALKQLGKGMRGGYAVRSLEQVVHHLEQTLAIAANDEAHAHEALKHELIERAGRRGPPGLSERLRDAVRQTLDKYGHAAAINLVSIAAAAKMTLKQLYAEIGDLAWHERSKTAMIARSHQWMARNDIRGFILLGDPAASVPLTSSRPPQQRSHEDVLASMGLTRDDVMANVGLAAGAVSQQRARDDALANRELTQRAQEDVFASIGIQPSGQQHSHETVSPSTTASSSPKLDVDSAEDIVFDLIHGVTDSRTAALKYGLHWRFVDKLKQTYTDAGRAALERLLKS